MVPINVAKTAAVGDLMGIASGSAVKASEQAWTTDLATTQTAFANLFAGASAQAKEANKPVFGNTGSNEGKIRVDAGGVRKYAATAGTYVIGQLVGPAKQTGNALEDQKVDIVASEALAIGRIVGGEGVNPTEVFVELLSKLLPAARQT
jgi:hypothetical protein